MVKSMNAAIAGLKSHQTRMDVLSNNIANVNTWGYKTRTANFQDAMYSSSINGAAGGLNNGNIGGVNTSQIGYGSTVSSISTNFTTGSGQYTGNPLDCMIDGTGFFIVGPMRQDLTDANGDPAPGINNGDVSTSGLYLSRVGIFQPDSNGYLVDGTGNYVYGYDVDANGVADTTKLVPIRIPENPASTATPKERLTITTWTIGTDGMIVGVDEDNMPHTIGQIAVAAVENPSGLDQTTGYLYTVGANAGNVTAMVTSGGTGAIKSNYLEMSNVDLASDMATMITTQRGYQANTKIITVTDEMLEQLVNMKR